MKKRYIMGAMVLFSSLFLSTASAAQYNPPWADLYGYGCVLCGYDGDFRAGATAAETPVDNMGYDTFIWENYGNEANIKNWLESDAIFLYSGHAQGWTANGNIIGIDFDANYYGVYITPSEIRSLSDLGDLRFAAAFSCWSGVYDPSYSSYSMAKAFQDEGTDAYLGFTDELYQYAFGDFSGKFFTNTDNGYTVSGAATKAIGDMWLDGGFDTWTIFGNSNLKLDPAAYGS